MNTHRRGQLLLPIYLTKVPILFNLYHSLGKYSRRQIKDTFIFQRKQALAFYANGILRSQFAWNVKAFFCEK